MRFRRRVAGTDRFDGFGKSAGGIADVGNGSSNIWQKVVGQIIEMARKTGDASTGIQKVFVRGVFSVVACAGALPGSKGVLRGAHFSVAVRMKARRSMIGASEKRNRSKPVVAASDQGTQDGITNMSPFSSA